MDQGLQTHLALKAKGKAQLLVRVLAWRGPMAMASNGTENRKIKMTKWSIKCLQNVL